MICPKHHTTHPKGDRCPNIVLAKAEARSMRRAARVAENAVLPTAPYTPAASQDAPGPQKPKRGPRPNRTHVRGGAGKPKKKKSPSMSKLKKALWTQVSAYVRARDRREDAGRCLACRTRPIEVAAHIIPSNEGAATRYDEFNLYGCCITCNGLEKWNRASWVYKHKEMFGAERVDQLYAQSRQITQFKRNEILAMTEDFQAKRRELC